MIRLLVVAPNASLRNSLRFALEAEGYDVTAVAKAVDVNAPPSSFSCTVLDHHGLEGAAEKRQQFLHEFRPVVLLANTVEHPQAAVSFRTLTKPFLGQALSEAIRAALPSGAHP